MCKDIYIYIQYNLVTSIEYRQPFMAGIQMLHYIILFSNGLLNTHIHLNLQHIYAIPNNNLTPRKMFSNLIPNWSWNEGFVPKHVQGYRNGLQQKSKRILDYWTHCLPNHRYQISNTMKTRDLIYKPYGYGGNGLAICDNRYWKLVPPPSPTSNPRYNQHSSGYMYSIDGYPLVTGKSANYFDHT